jgi:hypothetical protein
MEIVYPDAPKNLKDRVPDTLYLVKGGRIGKWDGKRDFLCVCKKGSSGCCGGVTINRCKAVLESRPVGDVLSLGSSSAGTSLSLASALPLPQRASRPDPSVVTKAEVASLLKFKAVIAPSKHSSKIWVLDDGRWKSDSMSEKQWVVTGQEQGENYSFPLPIGAVWIVSKSGKHADAVGQETVRIKIEIGVKNSEPFFSASNYDAGVFSHSATVTATQPSEVERLWLLQKPGEGSVPNATLNGKRFLGLSCLPLAQYFCSVTPGFDNADKMHGHSRGVGTKGEVGERQERRHMRAAIDGFELMLQKVGVELGKTSEEVFDSMLSSNYFKKYAESVIEYEKYKDPIIEAIIKAHAQSNNKAEKRYLLSLVCSEIGIDRSILLFGGTVHECKQANLEAKIRTLPRSYQPARSVCRVPKGTVDHMKCFVLNPENVLRAAHGEHGNFQLQRLLSRKQSYVKYVRECNALGIQPYGQTKFYEIFSGKIFRDTKRETCCCAQCVDGDLAFESLKELLPTISSDASQLQVFKHAVENVQSLLKWDYKSLLLKSSEDYKRCMTLALSQPDEPAFRQPCNHQHINSEDSAVLWSSEILFCSLRAQIAARTFASDEIQEDVKWALGEAENGVNR